MNIKKLFIVGGVLALTAGALSLCSKGPCANGKCDGDVKPLPVRFVDPQTGEEKLEDKGLTIATRCARQKDGIVICIDSIARIQNGQKEIIGDITGEPKTPTATEQKPETENLAP